MILAVFFPSLMGIGIIVSGALLLSDQIRRLFPSSGRRRRHRIVVGTYGIIGNAVEAAGYRLDPPWFVNRERRSRTAYGAIAVAMIAGAALSIWSGHRLFDDPLGVFYKSPWAIGIGYGVAAAFLLIAVLHALVAIAYRTPPRPLRYLICQTSLGRIVLPTSADHDAAITHVEKEP